MNINELKKSISSNRKLSDVLFIFWAGGAALLSYSLVYALRKPFTAATFDGLDFFGMDYKTVTSIVQIFGYFLSKLIGIKVISELKKRKPVTIYHFVGSRCRIISCVVWFASPAVQCICSLF